MNSGPDEGIGVAVIGAGMAGLSHAHGYRLAHAVSDDRLPPVRLVALADPNEPLAADAARRYGFERHVASWQEVAADPSIGAVSVVVANDLHLEIARGLLAEGKHVLCEKPLANTLGDGEAMVEAAAATGLVAALGYSYRRAPSINAIREEIARGRFGRLRHLELHYWGDYAADPATVMTWRYRGGPGTGALADLGTHLIDVGEFLAGPIGRVSAGTLMTFVERRPVPLGPVVGHGRSPVSGETAAVENEDVATFSATFESGAVGSFSISRTATGHPNGMGFSVFGERAAASFDQARPAEFRFYDATAPEETRGFRQVLGGPLHPYIARGLPMAYPGVGYGYAEMFAYQARAFLDEVAGVTDGLPRCPSFVEGLHTMRAIDAVVRSAARGGATVEVEGRDIG